MKDDSQKKSRWRFLITLGSKLFPLDSPIQDERQRQKMVAQWAGLVLLSMLSIWVVIDLFFASWTLAIWHLAIVIAGLVIMGLTKLGLPALVVAHLFCLLMIVTLAVSGYFSGGPTPSVLSLFAVAPVAAVTAAGLSGIVWVLPTIAMAAAFFYYQARGMEFPFLTPPEGQALDYSLTWLTAAATITLLIYYYEASRKRLEAKLIETLEATERISDQRNRLLRLFGHEIRTPLHGILGLLGLMKDESDHSVRLMLGRRAREAGNILLKTVNGVLEISREGSGDIEVFVPILKSHIPPISVPIAQCELSGPKTIMIVEDDAVCQMLASTLLGKMGYQTCLVADGRQAIEVYEKGKVGLILMDCQLPGLDGLEVAKKIRKMEKDSGRSPVPIVAVSAQVSTEHQQACLLAGMNDFLPKPFGKEELENVVKRWLK